VRHPAVEREVRTRCGETDVLEGEPPQDERHQLQRHHREADERHERDQADARPRERRDERRAHDQGEDDQEHARQRRRFHAHESPDRAKRIGEPDVVGGHHDLSQQIDQVDESDPEDQPDGRDRGYRRPPDHAHDAFRRAVTVYDARQVHRA